jgi:hypothetical protein
MNNKLTDEQLKRLIIIVKRSAFQFGLDKNEVEQFKEIHSALTELQEYRRAAPVEINDEMAFAFCRALSDDSVGSDEVEDIKTGLRAAFANITTSQLAPAIEAVPVVPPEANGHRARMVVGFNKHAQSGFIDGWNACRAAMLNHSGEGAEKLNHSENALDMVGGWIKCSERMPPHSKTALVVTAFGEYWTGHFDRTDVFWCDEYKVENVTHWMPLPAAPQQEAKS